MYWHTAITRSLQLAFVASLLATLPLPGMSFAQSEQFCNSSCEVPDRGDGTIDIPAECPFFALNGGMEITEGLPPSSSLLLDPALLNFTNVIVNLGGEIIECDADMYFGVYGTGALSSFIRSLSIPVHLEIHTAPRFPGDPVQSFRSDIDFLMGEVVGDPDFDLLRVSAGAQLTFASPGHTTLSQMPNGDFLVDSFFDIAYRIEMEGASGSPLQGYSGTGEGVVRMEQGEHFWNPEDSHKMHFAQLPDLEGWDVNSTFPVVVGDDWQCSETGWVKDIHFWGSWLSDFESIVTAFEVTIHADVPAGVDLPYSHPGEVLWQRTIFNYCMQPMEIPSPGGWYDPPLQGVLQNNHNFIFQYDIELDSVDWFWQEVGTIYWLTISANVAAPEFSSWGWHSSFDHFNDDAAWNVVTSFCQAPDNQAGTIDLPAQCPYEPEGTIDFIDGLPPGSIIHAKPTLHEFTNVVSTPNGPLGGEDLSFQALLELEMFGNIGPLGFNRQIDLIVDITMNTAPRTPLDPVQSFQCGIFSLEGELFGDPDFQTLHIQAGNFFTLPCPGQTTLTQLRGGDWNVDSFFDIAYQIEFEGAPGSPLQGAGAIFEGMIQVHQGGPPENVWSEIYEPPAFNQSMDMAFVITAGSEATITPCDCLPGDADGDSEFSIGDAVYLVNYIFAQGAPPDPICNGDANCDCSVNISDAVFLVNFIFASGPAPCDCETWRASCGNP